LKSYPDAVASGAKVTGDSNLYHVVSGKLLGFEDKLAEFS